MSILSIPNDVWRQMAPKYGDADFFTLRLTCKGFLNIASEMLGSNRDLASRLVTLFASKPKYEDFFRGCAGAPYTNIVVDLRLFHVPQKDVVDKILAVFPKIALRITNQLLSDTEQAAIVSLIPTPRELHCPRSDVVLQALTSTQELEVLDLSRTQVTSQALLHLVANAPRLRWLDLRGAQVSCEAILTAAFPATLQVLKLNYHALKALFSVSSVKLTEESSAVALTIAAYHPGQDRIACLEKALVKMPGYSAALLALAEQNVGTERKAALLKSCLENEPDNLSALVCQGTLRYSLNDCKGALASFEKAYELDSTSPYIQKYLGDLLRAGVEGVKAQPSRALYLLGAASKANRNDTFVIFSLAALFSTGAVGVPQNRKRAIALLERLVAIDPNHYNAFIALGDLYWAESCPQEALECYSRASVIKPDDTYAKKMVESAQEVLNRI